MKRRHQDDEAGSAVVELTLMVPAIVLILMLVVAAGRIVQARNDVAAAAGDAARAASVRQHRAGATRAAEATARRSLADRGVSCAQVSVNLGGGDLSPGSAVAVDVSCSVNLADLGLLGVPGSRTVSARGIEVVDQYRSLG